MISMRQARFSVAISIGFLVLSVVGAVMGWMASWAPALMLLPLYNSRRMYLTARRCDRLR